jgi:hypothetical protein
VKKNAPTGLDAPLLQLRAQSILRDHAFQFFPNINAENDVAEALVAVPSLQDIGELPPRLSDVDDGSFTTDRRCAHLADDGAQVFRNATVTRCAFSCGELEGRFAKCVIVAIGVRLHEHLENFGAHSGHLSLLDELLERDDVSSRITPSTRPGIAVRLEMTSGIPTTKRVHAYVEHERCFPDGQSGRRGRGFA